MIKLVVGLGNPGREYELNRHNIGWLVLDNMSKINSNIWKNKFKGEYTDCSFDGEKVYFLKPQTFMNLSGQSVWPLCQFFKIKPSEVLVLHDELDIPFGQIQFKKGGGLAGHNGLKSIAKDLGTQDFYRMRIGIGRPPRGSVSSWVLADFPKDKDIELGIVLENSAKAIIDLFSIGFKKASNQYNRKDFLKLE
ncbi:MAG: aminoacyl-tRNA hydrolase [Bacteriovoracaceae bacterium]|jgi:PTH1 family peptidyl-tRNA hydrolase|nr:aminoacyl-tRNA hydrolase [Bacteriovoracaceae bacterium]